MYPIIFSSHDFFDKKQSPYSIWSIFFKNILGGPDLNPLPNDVSDARPERGACCYHQSQIQCYQFICITLVLWPCWGEKFWFWNFQKKICVFYVSITDSLTNRCAQHLHQVHKMKKNILSRRARIASLQIIPKNTVLFLIFYCRWEDKCAANSLSLPDLIFVIFSPRRFFSV